MIKTEEEMSRYLNEIAKNSYPCSCGHKVLMNYKQNKKLCSWCGRYVYKNKRDEFREKLEEKIKSERL